MVAASLWWGLVGRRKLWRWSSGCGESVVVAGGAAQAVMLVGGVALGWHNPRELIPPLGLL